MNCLAVVTTVADRDAARKMADALVARGLAACAQISEIQSVYRWQGEMCNDREIRVLFKTTDERYAEVEHAILELHGYELPAIHAFDFAHVHAPYADWIEASCSAQPIPMPES